jgi:hypothetical protein
LTWVKRWESATPANAVTVEEAKPRTRPDWGKQFFYPTIGMGCLTLVGVISGGAVLIIILSDRAGVKVTDTPAIMVTHPALVVLLGLAVTTAAVLTIVTGYVRLGIYDAGHYEYREYQLAEEANDEGELAFEAAPENPTVRVRGKYRWRVGEKAQMALTIYTKDGEWRGRGKLARWMVKDWMTAASRRYKLMCEDFLTWGWIDENNHFTDQGINKIYEWLETAPPRRNRAAGLRTGRDDGHGRRRTDQGVA